MRLTAMEEPRQGTRGLRLGLALAAGLAVSACATAGGGAGSGPGIVRFYNTTDACTGVLPLTVALGSATWPVPPGGDVAITIPAGVHVAEVHARGDLLERHTWEVGAGAVVEDFVGCAAPELTRAGEGRARVRLELPAAGCAPGLHGPVSVSLGGRPAGRVGRGEVVARWLPVGWEPSTSTGARSR
ncbi:MAG: hypothetical protein H6745_02755 [Deltaproteobacteria bacterium]|nr:hypothetical protein [Deltaproteobacteria bacterium]